MGKGRDPARAFQPISNGLMMVKFDNITKIDTLSLSLKMKGIPR